MWLTGCANKDWYIHLKAKPEMPLELKVGRGSSTTVHKVVDEDSDE